MNTELARYHQSSSIIGVSRRSLQLAAGFSILEIVMVLVIIGILSIVVGSRLMSADALGYAEQTRESLRFAQKSAIAKRRNVCVTFKGNVLTLTLATNPGAASPCDIDLLNPAGNRLNPAGNGAFQQTAPGGLTVADVKFSFDSQGRPSAAQKLVITESGSSSTPIVIEAETGYVR